MSPSFSMVRVGTLTVNVSDGDEPYRFMVTLIRSGATGPFQILGSDAEFGSLEDAQSQAESYGSIEWRATTEPLADEQACFLCGCTMGRLLEARARHPKRICQVCALEAVDARGERVRFGNVDMSGGLRGWYVDGGAAYGRCDCVIRGLVCEAREARFGGVVIEPR